MTQMQNPSERLSVYKNKAFARFAKKARIKDSDLLKAAQLADKGVIDADLGGGVIKQRIARVGEGSQVDRVRSFFSEKVIAPYMFTVLRRRILPISNLTKWRHFENWRR